MRRPFPEGESAPDLSNLPGTGALWPQLQAVVERIEALPFAGAPEAEAEQRHSLEALRLALPNGNSVGCSYSQCVNIPAVSIVNMLIVESEVWYISGAQRC